jgi:Gas vesicle synthesis protein GvpL/GvpF
MTLCMFGLYLAKNLVELSSDLLTESSVDISVNLSQFEFPGIKAGKLQYLNFSGFSAVIQLDFDRIQLESQSEDEWIAIALDYGRVQSQVFGKVSSMLPWSFRSAFFEDLPKLQQFLEVEKSLLLAKLKSLEGYGEFSLIARVKQQSESEQSLAGRAYFALRKQEFERKQQLNLDAKLLVEMVQPNPNRICWEQVREQELLRVSVLLKIEEVEQVRQNLINWQILRPGWQIQLGEALPPYSFVGNSLLAPL